MNLIIHQHGLCNIYLRRHRIMRRPDIMQLLMNVLANATHKEQTLTRESSIYNSFDNEDRTLLKYDPDEDLVQQLANGSEAVFTAIYNLHSYALLNFARNLLDNRQNAEDVCADVFTKMWELRGRFTNIQNIKAFLFVSVRNSCLNFIRSEQIKMEVQKRLVEQLEHIALPEDITDVKSEYKERLRKEIDSLPDQCQRIFKLAFYQELKNKEIANLLQISIKTVSNQKVLALQFLRNSQKITISFVCVAFIWLIPTFQ